jgi:nucleoid-associated protein YgaU
VEVFSRSGIQNNNPIQESTQMIKFSYKHAAVFLFAALLAAGCQVAPEDPTDAQRAAEAAMDEARAAIARAEDPCTGTGEAGNYLRSAESAFGDQDFAEAERLASQAAAEAERAINECYCRLTGEKIDQIKKHTNLTSDQRNRLRNLERAYERGNCRDAYETARSMASEIAADTTTYRVVRGDSLWRISGRSEVYGDPYQWPLIYKKNTDKIQDADLIYPDQRLDIQTHPTESARDRATQHARTRGAWQLGRVEESDRRYLREARD